MGNYLSERRKEIGLTQREVAEAVGVAEATVSRWESGEIANMRRDKISALAKVLHCSPNFVMTGEQSAVPTIGDRMRLRRKELGLSAEKVAERLGVSPATVYRYEKGDIEKLPGDILPTLSEILQTTPAYLMGWDESVSASAIPPGFEPLPKMVKRPLVGSIACGEPITAEENIEDYVDVPENVQCDFCLRCKGDSMIDAGIHDGDVVYIHITPQVENGQIAAVRIDGEATLKRVFWDESSQTLTLLAENRNFAPLVYTGPILETVHVEGRAVGYTHWF